MYKNHVELIGFLGQDPELKTSANHRPFTRLSVATTERWKDKAGQYQERTEWHSVFFWGPRAEGRRPHPQEGFPRAGRGEPPQPFGHVRADG
jgi:single-strand DNA-binding protein